VDVLIGFGTQAAIYTRLKSCKPPTEHAIRIFQVALRFYGCHSRYFRDIREANHLRKLFAVVSLFTADLFCLPGSLGVCLMANVLCKQAKRAVHKHTFTIFLPLPLRISPVYLAHFNYISIWIWMPSESSFPAGATSSAVILLTYLLTHFRSPTLWLTAHWREIDTHFPSICSTQRKAPKGVSLLNNVSTFAWQLIRF